MDHHSIRRQATVIAAALLVFGIAAHREVVAAEIDWRADSGRVRLKAADLAIAANDKILTVGDADVTVHGDRGDLLYWTLEAEWREQGVPMRLFIYFTSDGTDWWATSIRTYDGTERGDWVEYRGEFFRTPLGKPFAGDLFLTDPERSCSLRLTKLRLETAP